MTKRKELVFGRGQHRITVPSARDLQRDTAAPSARDRQLQAERHAESARRTSPIVDAGMFAFTLQSAAFAAWALAMGFGRKR